MKNSNKKTDHHQDLDEEDVYEIDITVNLAQLILTFVIGWLALPLYLKKVISVETATVYILWTYAFFNIKVVSSWGKFLLKSIFVPARMLKFSYIGKFLNFIYIFLNLLLQIVAFAIIMKYIYINEIASLFGFLLIIIQPIFSDVACKIGSIMFCRKPK